MYSSVFVVKFIHLQITEGIFRQLILKQYSSLKLLSQFEPILIRIVLVWSPYSKIYLISLNSIEEAPSKTK